MVKIINIDTKTRTIHVSNEDGKIKAWRTTESGAHFPIKEGESTKEALDKFVEKKRPGATPKTAGQLKKAAEKLESDPAYHYERADRLSEMIKQREKELDSPNISPTAKKAIERGIGDLQLAISKHWDAAGKLEKAQKKQQPAKKESGLLGDKPTPDELLKTPKAREVYDRLTRYAAEHNKDLQEDDMKHLRSLRDILLDDNNAAEHVEKNFQKWFGSGKSESAKKESVPDRMMRYKNTMQETMDSFGTLYSWEKPHLEEFAKKIYDDISKNPEKEKEFLEHTYEAYNEAAKRLGMWVDTPTLVKRSFIKKLLDGQKQKDDTEAEESRWGNAGLGTAFYDLKK